MASTSVLSRELILIKLSSVQAVRLTQTAEMVTSVVAKQESVHYSQTRRCQKVERRLQENCVNGACNYCVAEAGKELFYSPEDKACRVTCNDNEVEIGNHCINCDASCVRCSGPRNTDCLECGPGSKFTPKLKKCVTGDCPTGFYTNSIGWCEECDAKCLSCFAHKDNNCYTCAANYLYWKTKYTCLQNCQPGTYQLGSQCLECHGVCATCTAGSRYDCITCPAELLSQPQLKTCWTECHDGYYQDTNNRQCLKCNDQCTTCNGPNNNQCLTCPGGKYLHSQLGTCVDECPGGTYLDQSICFNCNAACASCEGGSLDECLTCPAGKIYVPSLKECWDTCPDNFHLDSDNQCYPCDDGCLACNELSNNDCDSCDTGKLLVTKLGTCVDQCTNGFYLSGGTCEECHSTCATCAKPDECLTCVTGLLLSVEDNKCYTSCGEGLFQNGIQCDECHSTCLTCSGPANNQCLSCPPALVLFPENNDCQDQCPDGYYELDGACYKCHDTCQNCEGPGSNDCIDCAAGKLYKKPLKTCVDECGLGYFKTDELCLTCHSECQTCNGPDNNNCLTCPDTRRMVEDESSCSVSCNDGFYDMGQECRKCDPSCKGCFGPTASQCKSCELPSKYNAVLSTCEFPCSDGYFDNGSICEGCHASCTTCSGPEQTDCTSCATDLGLAADGKCVTGCGNNFFILDNKCEPCHTDCLTCTGFNPEDCLTCQPPNKYVPSQGHCVNPCPDLGFYLNNDKCLDCNNQCLSCSGPENNQCLSCPPTKFHVPSSLECVDACAIQHYYRQDFECLLCHETCNTCRGPAETDCTTCALPLRVVTALGTCVDTCPAGYTEVDQDKCEACDSSCKTCNGLLTTSCTSCNQPFMLSAVTGECLTQCEDGYFQDNTVCVKCDDACATCTGPASNECTSCNAPAYLTPFISQCVQKCLPGYYLTPENECHICDATCLTCTGPDPVDCSTCPDSVFLDTRYGTCVSPCPTATYEEGVVCIQCHGDCLTCNGPSSVDCTSCSDPLLHNPTLQTCTDLCVPTFYKDQFNQCLQCLPECATCEAPDSCTSCPGQTYLHEGKCVLQCPAGTYLLNGQCLPCDVSCATCMNSLNHGCLTCNDPPLFTPLYNTCSDECIHGFYLQDQDCLPCHSECSTCTGPQNTQCTSCELGMLFTPVLGTCSPQCVPQGYFEFSGQCLECASECATCQERTSNDCLTCSLNYYLIQDTNTCTDTCPTSFFLNSTLCQPCHSSCYECSGAQAQECTQCDSYHYFYLGGCELCPSTIDSLQGDQLFTMLAQCRVSITDESAAQMALQSQFVDPYVQGGASVTQYERYLEANRNILLNMDAANFMYQTDNTVSFKAPLNVLGDTHIILDEGLLHGAKVELIIPSSVAEQLPAVENNLVVGAVLRKGLYALQQFGTFESPAVQFQIISDNQIINLSSLDPPVQLIISPNTVLPDVPVNGAYWRNSQWRSVSTFAVDQEARIQLTQIGGTFTLVLDFETGVMLREPDNLRVLYTFIGCYFGVFLICIIAGVACDLQGHYKGYDYYPHRQEIGKYQGLTAGLFFNFVFRYSLLYNTPWISVFIYRDRAIPMWARALWFFGLLGVIWSGAVILFKTDTLLRSSEIASILVYGALFGLLFIPNSFFIFMLTENVIDQESYILSKEKLPRQSLKTKELKDQDSDELPSVREVIAMPVLPSQVHRKISKRGISFYFILMPLFWITAFAVTAIMGKDLMYGSLTRFIRVMYTLLAAYLFGFFYTIFKCVIATSTAIQFRKPEGPRQHQPQSMGVQLFVDERTALVHQEVAGYLEANPAPMAPQRQEVSATAMDYPAHPKHANIFEGLPKVTDDSPANDVSEMPSYRNIHRTVFPPRSSNQSRRAFR